jgi:ATP-dependent helicase/nuclease subunit A
VTPAATPSALEAPRRIVLASAGTGKTWQLANAYLALLARGVGPERILATTFTRKAAGEILERVFARLVRACGDADERAKIGAAAGRALSATDCEELLSSLARGVHSLRISTLDAFFLQLAQLFGSELGLPPGWRIADELADAELRSEAIHALIEGQDQAERMVLLRELQRESGQRPVHSALLQAVTSAAAFAEESEERAWNRVHPPPDVEPAELEEARELALTLTAPPTASGKPHAVFQRKLNEVKDLAGRRAWRELLDNSFVQHVLRDEATTYSGAPIEPRISGTVQTLAQHGGHVLGLELVNQNRATWRLCARFKGAYAQLRRARRSLRFEHVERALDLLETSRIAATPGRPAAEPAANLGGLDSLFYRLGSSLEHVLLDEFQDTSPSQLRALLPLIRSAEERPGRARSFFCVGDPKQSIYGWRRAEPRLLRGLPARLGIAPEDLRTNFRSAPVILEAVDELFRDLAANEVFQTRELELAVAAEFAGEYTGHEPQRRDLAGTFRVRVAPEREPGAPGDHRAPGTPCIALAAQRAAELHRASPGSSIAILLRRNAHIGTLIYALRKLGVAASGEGGNPLTDSAAVLAALSWLWFADHPFDGAAHYHVATSPLAGVAGLEWTDPIEARAVQALELRRELSQSGFAGVLERARAAVRNAYGPWNQARFGQLLELASAWDAESTLRPSDFVQRARSRRVESADSGAVKVMTIHMAKGLEFDAVLLPELEQLRASRSPALVARRAHGEPLEPFEVVSRAGTKILRTMIPELSALYDEQRKRELQEALCALYVAMTRAIHHLEVIVPPPSDSETDGGPPPLTCAAIVRAAFAKPAPADGIYEREGSSQGWMRSAPPAPEVPAGAASSAEAPWTLGRTPRPRELARRSPSSLAARRGGPFAAALLARSGPSEARERGSRLHLWLQQIEWLEDFRASDAELLELARERGLGGARLEADLQRLRSLLEGPNLRALLSRACTARRLGASDSVLTVWRERAFAQRVEGEGADGTGACLLHGAFDRAVGVRQGPASAKFARAELVDFKSDRVDSAEDLRERAEQYGPQLAAYRGALARIAELAPASIACRIHFLEPDRLLDLELG